MVVALLLVAAVASAELPDAGAQAAPVPEAAATVAEEPSISLLAAGDITLGQHFETFTDEQLAKGAWTADDARHYAFDLLREQTAAADLFVANLECPFTWRGEKIAKNFNFRARPELSGVLLDGGLDAVSLANNHLFDYGAEGVVDTITTLRAHGLPFFGAGMDLAGARAPAILERKGVKVAFLGYFFLGDRNIEPPEVYATDRKPGVAGCYRGDGCIGAMVEADVKAARTRADLVIPFFHWGREAQDEVTDYQRLLARRAVDAGAALVLGSHPHVIHGIERYKGVPIVYSMGNFVFGGNWGPRDEFAIAVRARLTKAGVQSLEVLPMQFTNPPDRRFQPRWLEGAQAQPVLDRVRALSEKLEGPPVASETK